MTARWRKQPDERGLARHCQGPRGYQLRDGGELLITVAPKIGARRAVLGWYWYGLGRNSCGTPNATADGARAEADDYYRAWKERTTGGRPAP